MAEVGFLTAVETYLAAAGLQPAPATIGVLEPTRQQDLPALVLSLDDARRAGAGLGARAELVTEGALAVGVTLDLASPVLADLPDFPLVQDGRRRLVLPHGGLVRADGTEGDLGPGDLTITVGGNPRAFESAEPLDGTVRFANPLPAAGVLAASYFVGRWDRLVVRLEGVLRVDVLDRDVDDLRALANATLRALLRDGIREALPGLRVIDARALSSVGPQEAAAADARRRSLLLGFDYEHRVDRPESAGGLIRRIRLESVLWADPTADEPTIEIDIVS